MKKNRIISLILAALLCVGTLAACGDSKTKNDTKATENTEATDNSGETTPEAPDRAENPIGLDAYDWKYDDDEVLFTIGGHPIMFDEYRFMVMSYKLMTDGGDDSYWTEETEKDFMDSYISQFKMYAAIKLYAEQNNITLTDEDYAAIDEHINSFVTQLGEEGFKNLLLENYVTEETYRRVLEYDLYSEKLVNLFPVSEEEVLQYANENYVHVQHVLISTLDEENNPLEGDALAEKTKLAEEIAERAKNGEDFYSLVEEYGEDPGMEGNPDGYTFTYNEMVPEFEAESFALEVGGISDPVKTSFGYHIIKKLPLEITPESAEYEACKQNVAGTNLSTVLADFAETLEIVYTDAYKNLTMTNIGTLTEAARKAAEITEKVSESTVNVDTEADAEAEVDTEADVEADVEAEPKAEDNAEAEPEAE